MMRLCPQYSPSLFFHEFARARELEEEESKNSSASFPIHQPLSLQHIPDEDKEAYRLESLPEGKPLLSA
jgi:hypothetical protein